MAEQELMHYGVLGMKWGVRRYQRKNGSLTAEGKARYDHDKVVIKKGSEVQRISKTSNETSSGRTFVSFKDLDNLKYEAMAGEDGLWWTSNYDGNNPNDPNLTNRGFKIKLKVTDDIIAPSYRESIDAFVKTVEDVPVKELAERVYGRKEDQRSRYQKQEYKKNTREFVKNMKHLTVDDAKEQAYLEYSRSLMRSKENQKEFFSELQKRGYNAVVDHNDAVPKDGNDWVDMPIIVFEKSNTLKQISATPITDVQRELAEMRVLEELERRGE